MDTTDEEIVFDNGICDHCITFREKTLPKWINGKDDNFSVKQLAKKIKSSSKGRDYDCIIGLSGGIDSSYLTYVAKEILELRPLVSMSGGWNTQGTVNNMKNL